MSLKPMQLNSHHTCMRGSCKLSLDKVNFHSESRFSDFQGGDGVQMIVFQVLKPPTITH